MIIEPLIIKRLLAPVLVGLILIAGGTALADTDEDDTFDEEAILAAATDFFGETTQGLAKVIQKVFEDQGRPNAYIAGEEISGAIGIGVR